MATSPSPICTNAVQNDLTKVTTCLKQKAGPMVTTTSLQQVLGLEGYQDSLSSTVPVMSTLMST